MMTNQPESMNIIFSCQCCVCRFNIKGLRALIYTIIFSVYSPAQIDDAIEKNEGVTTAYADLFPGYPTDMKMAEDLATFVSYITFDSPILSFLVMTTRLTYTAR